MMKKGLLAILMDKHKGESDSEESGEPSAESDDLESIAEELISAVKDGNASDVASALRAAYAHCGSEE